MQDRPIRVRSGRCAAVFLLALLSAAAGLAQSPGLELPPCETLEITLSNAELMITLRPGAEPRMTVRAGGEGDAAGEDPAELVEPRKSGATLGLRRAATAGNAHLRVEVVLGSVQAVTIRGDELDVAMTVEAGRGAPPRTTTALTLERSHAEIDGHRGNLALSGKDSEIELRGVGAEIDLNLQGGTLQISDAAGRLIGKLRRNAVLLVSDWSGEIDLEAVGSALDLRNFQPDPQILSLKTKATDVAIEALGEGLFDLDQTGGELLLRDVGRLTGKIATGLRAKVEIARVAGAWTGVFQDSEVRIDGVEDLVAELYNSVLELDGARRLDLLAHGSRITATSVQRISRLNLVTSTADLELTEGSRADVMVQGLSEARLRLPRPCFVQVEDARVEGDQSSDGPGLDVTGCTLGEAPADDPDASFLSGIVGGSSTLTVREGF